MALTVGAESRTEKAAMAAGLLAWLIGGLMFYVSLADLVVRLNRSLIVWIGGSIVLAPIGPFVAYFNMRRLVKDTIRSQGNLPPPPPSTLIRAAGTLSRKYRGWLRLGVVLSVTWCALVFAYAAYDHFATNRGLVEAIANQDEASKRAGWDYIGQVTTFTRCEVKGNAVSCQPRIWHLLLATAGPLIAMWLLGILGSIAYLWVRAGFRDEDA